MMLRTILRTPITRATTIRTFTTTRPSYSLVDDAKQKLDDLNHKIGEVAAKGIGKTQQATEAVKENAKDKIHNESNVAGDLKTDAANTSYNDVREGVKKTAKDVKDAFAKDGQEGVEAKAREHLGNENVNAAKETARDLKEDSEEILDKAANQTGGLKRDAEKKFAQKAQETADKYKGV